MKIAIITYVTTKKLKYHSLMKNTFKKCLTALDFCQYPRKRDRNILMV